MYRFYRFILIVVLIVVNFGCESNDDPLVIIKQWSIDTFAGIGFGGYSGDGGKPTDALLKRPGSIVLGPFGTIYIGESSNSSYLGVHYHFSGNKWIESYYDE